MVGTPNLASVKATLPGPVDEIAALSVAAAREARRLEDSVAATTEKQRRLLEVFRRNADVCGVGAA